MSPIELLREGQTAYFAEPPDYPKSKELFHRVTLSAPDWSEGYHWLACAAEMTGNPSEAIESFETAIRCGPADSRPQIALGRLLLTVDRPEEAIARLRDGIALKPHYGEPDARLLLAEAYEKTGDIQRAVEQWTTVGRMAPEYPSEEMPMREARRKLRQYAGR